MSGDVSGVEQATVNPVKQAVESIVKATQDRGKPESSPESGKTNTLQVKNVNYSELGPETKAMLDSTKLPYKVPLIVEVISTEDTNGGIAHIEVRYSGWETKANSHQAKWVTLTIDPQNPSAAKLGVRADTELPTPNRNNLSITGSSEYLTTKYTIPNHLKKYADGRSGNLSPLIIELAHLTKEPRPNNGLRKP